MNDLGDADTAPKLKVCISKKNVLFPRSMLINSPSRSEGCSLEDEIKLRIIGCERIQHAGRLLELSQPVVATAQILFQRFYLKKSIITYNIKVFAIASIILAGKCEESSRRIRDVINVFKYIEDKLAHPKSSVELYDYYGMDYIKMKSFVIDAERRILKELGFLVHVQHSHKWIVSIMKIIGCEDNLPLLQKAWNYMNDSLKIPVFLFHETEYIACGCVNLAARSLGVALPTSPPWWLVFGMNECELNDICKQIAYLYTLPKLEFDSLMKDITSKMLCKPRYKYEDLLSREGERTKQKSSSKH